MCKRINFLILVIYLSIILTSFSTKATQLNETTIKNNYLITKARQFSIIPSLLNGLDVFDLQIPINIPYSSYITDLISNATDNGITTSSLLNLNVMSISLLAGLFLFAYLLYPKYFADIGISSFRSLGDLSFFAIEDISEKFNKAMDKFEINSTTCMKVALCTLGKANYNNKLAKTKSFTTTDLLDAILRYFFQSHYKLLKFKTTFFFA
jgi:hypothetical protein